MNAVLKNRQDYLVADIGLASWGDKEIRSPKPKCRA
jgi:hypothetical protein